MLLRKITFVSTLALVFAGCGDMGKKDDAKVAPKKAEVKEAKKEEKKEAKAEPKLSNKDAALAALDAFNAGDLDKLVSLMTDDVTAETVGGPMPAVTGKDGIRERVTMLRSAVPDAKYTHRRIFDGGEVIITQSVVTGTHKGEFMGIKPTDKPVGWEDAHVFWVQDGKIKKILAYMNPAAMMAQIGGTPKDMPVPPVPAAPEGEPETVSGPGKDENIDALKKTYEGFSKGDASVAETGTAADAVLYGRADGREIKGPKDLKKDVEKWLKAFPDTKIETEDVWAIGDYVIARTVQTGTHKGKLDKIKATNKSVTVHSLDIVKFEGGKAKTIELYENHAEMAIQLGLMQPPPPPAPAGAEPAGEAKAEGKADAKAEEGKAPEGKAEAKAEGKAPEGKAEAKAEGKEAKAP